MNDLILPRDAFSHGQIRSKLWLSEHFAVWSTKHLLDRNYTLNWYGSWVGIGPFILLQNTKVRFNKINLFDLNSEHLEISRQVLDFWRCESIAISTKALDVNEIVPDLQPDQLFINTSCEHINNDIWLKNIPKGSLVLLQSTNMPHPEHTNCASNLDQFVAKYGGFITLLESEQIDFNYPDKEFSRFMLLGRKI